MKKGGEHMKKRPLIITKRSTITLPKPLREMLDLQPGDCLDYLVMANGTIVLARKECCNTPKLLPLCMMAKAKGKC
jgi:AbrB family looped-hinge helix DNA binding protein